MAETVWLPERAGTGLSYGLLAWVLAGHAAAVWLARASLEAGSDTLPPRVLRVSWVEAPRPVAPPPAKPDEAKPQAVVARGAAQTPEPDQPAQVAEPVPVAPPVAAPASLPAPAAEPAPPVAPAELPAAPVPALQPPSYHADYLANPAPTYPAISRRLGEEGMVRLRVLVGPDGLPREVRLDAGSGHVRLDEAARAAVAAWRFVPARLGGQAMSGWVGVPISFSLRR